MNHESMIVMKKWIFLSLFSLAATFTQAQELNFSLTINTPQLQLTDPAIFETMRQSLENFMNNRKWTKDAFEVQERINGNIQMTITEEVSATSFKANMQIQVTRPIYGSSAQTVILSHNDKDIAFDYEPFQPIEYTNNVFNDNLSSIFTFYIYFALGLDYDTFSPFGGEPYFQEAQLILNTVPSNVAASVGGWRSIDSQRNRYWMIESMLSPRMRPFRKAMYDYHRQSLDIMNSDVETGRAVMTQAIEELGKVNRSYPNSMTMQMFVNAKGSEIVEIFKKGTRPQKAVIKRVMGKVDAANASNYRRIGS